MDVRARTWPRGLPAGLRERLETAYADPRRGYHDLRHLDEVLTGVEDLTAPDEPGRVAVVLAAWFHDAVYEGGPEDEERSARLALDLLPPDVLAGAGLDPSVATEVARLVRLTATHRPGEDDRPGQVLCDADLAVLASDPARYTEYVRGVRGEYAHVSDPDFAAGRAAILEDLLAKPTVFHGDAARTRWEARARENVRRELETLGA